MGMFFRTQAGQFVIPKGVLAKHFSIRLKFDATSNEIDVGAKQ
jgi:hypothetical protein